MAKANKRYEAGVERALGLFDTSNEWADYIAFLSRLNRSLRENPEGADIPSKRIVAKYLAQCLNPSLPSGVHQKALEVYSLIFDILGTDHLARDLALYLPGISHTLTFASLSIRPLFLSLMHDHVLKLSSPDLRPALKGIILSLLPGIEEEGAEDFEATLSVINVVRDLFAREGAESLFWQNLFLASITSPSRRLGVFVYLSRYLPKLGPDPSTSLSPGIDSTISEEVVLKPEPGLLIRCFATGLMDEQILVQRSFLDLLVTHLPLDACILSQSVASGDLDILVSAAVAVVLRRDMSLNKRLWSWLLGTSAQPNGHVDIDPNSPAESRSIETRAGGQQNELGPSFFETYCSETLLRSFKKQVERGSANAAEGARTFRIASSLMDKWEVGGPIVAKTFIPMMQNLQKFRESTNTEGAFEEVFRSANVFFNGVESGLIWSQLLQLLEAGDTHLILFILTHFDVQEDEMLTLHMPLFCLAVLHRLKVDESQNTADNASDVYKTESTPGNTASAQLIDLLYLVIQWIPQRAFGDADMDELQAGIELPKDHYHAIQDFYEKLYNASTHRTPPLPPGTVGTYLMRECTTILMRNLEMQPKSTSTLSLTFAALSVKVLDHTILKRLDLMPRLESILAIEEPADLELTYYTASSITVILTAMCAIPNISNIVSEDQVQSLVARLTTQYWTLLSAYTPQFHVESARYMVELDRISSQHRSTENAIASVVLNRNENFTKNIRGFATLWTHLRTESASRFLKRPVLLILDCLLSEGSAEAVKEWIQSLSFASLDFLSSIIIDGSHELRLKRLQALLATQSDSQWLIFSGESATTLRQRVVELCLEVLENDNKTSESFQTKHAATDALSLVRLIYGQENISENLQELSLRVTSTLLELLNDITQAATIQVDLLNTMRIVLKHSTSELPFSELSKCLLKGVSSSPVESLDKWTSLLCFVILNGADSIFQIMLKTTECFCTRLESALDEVCSVFDSRLVQLSADPEQQIGCLMNGLEYVLACAHDRLSEKEGQRSINSPELAQGLFGSMIATATHHAEVNLQRSSLANDRLTVVLCFQDAVKICVKSWVWATSSHTSSISIKASFHHVSSRIRSRSRRTLERFLRAETQEGLECVVGLWARAIKADNASDSSAILKLLQSLEGGRPRIMLPVTFNAIYNRTNPAALDKAQRSTLSTTISPPELIAFLIEYTKSLEDDLLEEIWTDCMTFLREVLGNPMPHRQILLQLLDFMSTLCSKIENTNFGEERKMRRELADVCTRLFTAIFTVKPGGLDGGMQDESFSKSSTRISTPSQTFERRNMVQILCDTLPVLSSVLAESDRLTTVLNGIATNITGPLLRAKLFPQSVSLELLTLLQVMAKASGASKIWRRDVLDAFSEPKFFQNTLSNVQQGWLPLIRQLSIVEKTLISDALSSITPPSSAGLVFGVGASAARAEADRKTQLVLRRIALLLLATEKDTFAGNLSQLLAKLEELFTATEESSPSSETRNDIFILIRAVVLTISPFNLAPVWPVIEAQLRETFSSLLTDASKYTQSAQLMAAKLLDLLLLLKPEEFQVHEWVFVTDTVDAIYPPSQSSFVALVDQVAQANPDSGESNEENTSPNAARKPWLCSNVTRETPSENINERLLQPFFRQLSIHAFEDSYRLSNIDIQACVDDLLADLFTG